MWHNFNEIHTERQSNFVFSKPVIWNCDNSVILQISANNGKWETQKMRKCESCGLVGSEDGSRSKGRGLESCQSQYTRGNGCQSHTGLINTPSLVLPRCFKWLLTNRVLGSKKKVYVLGREKLIETNEWNST